MKHQIQRISVVQGKGGEVGMTDRAYIVSRTLEDKIAIAENNDQNTLIVTLDVLKNILAMLKEQQQLIDEITQRRANNGAFD